MIEKEYEPFGKVWKKVLEKGKKVEPKEKGITHKLSPASIALIVGTADRMGCNPTFVKQLSYDLRIPKFRLFDLIGMLLTDRYKGYPDETPEEVEAGERFTKLMASLYLTKSIPEMLESLRKPVGEIYEKEIEKAKKKLKEAM